MWIAKAPSNIALIKYMGKHANNVPWNVSLSYTLEKFVSEVKLDLNSNEDRFAESTLTDAEKNRFLAHLNYIKKITEFRGYFSVSSQNSYPKSAGIASSASSFAALTICAFKAISDIQGKEMPSNEYMSAVSRLGSGSSCRSFFSPWCLWTKDSAREINIPVAAEHELILIDSSKKKISSSEAHKLVQTSLLLEGRERRAQIRCENLIKAFETDDWQKAYQICWDEFWDMHALFETSNPNFGYILPKTLEYLIRIRNFWRQYNDGPIITIDAGPNIHLLWRKNENISNLRQMFNQCMQIVD